MTVLYVYRWKKWRLMKRKSLKKMTVNKTLVAEQNCGLLNVIRWEMAVN
jgi:hypothetical protein